VTRRWSFWAVFAAATLLIAGVVSLRGCQVVKTAAGEQLTGDCIAQQIGEHHLADSPLAGYALGAREGTGGLAGVIGVLVTVGVAGGGFWLIARTRPGRSEDPAVQPSGR